MKRHLIGDEVGEHIDMPIVEAVYRVVYEAAPAQAMVEELLSRGLKAEF